MVMAKIDRRPTLPGNIRPMPMPMPKPAPFPFPKPVPMPCPIPGGNLPEGLMDQVDFKRKDKDRSDSLSLDEFLRSKNGEITQKDVDRFNRYDRNGDGQVSRQEFLDGRKWDRSVREFVKKGWEGVRQFGDSIKLPLDIQNIRPTAYTAKDSQATSN